MWRTILEKRNDAPVLGMNRRNLELVAPRNERQYFPIADDKLLAKRRLEQAGVAVAPTLATFESFRDVALWREKISDLQEFVVKPARGSGGRGILVISERRDDGFVTAGGHVISQREIVKRYRQITALGISKTGSLGVGNGSQNTISSRIILTVVIGRLWHDAGGRGESGGDDRGVCSAVGDRGRGRGEHAISSNDITEPGESKDVARGIDRG